MFSSHLPLPFPSSPSPPPLPLLPLSTKPYGIIQQEIGEFMKYFTEEPDRNFTKEGLGEAKGSAGLLLVISGGRSQREIPRSTVSGPTS